MGMRCPFCGKNVPNLPEHLEKSHINEIPDGMTVKQFIFYKKYGSTKGVCMVCHRRNTPWNPKTDKPRKICLDPKCAEYISKKADENYYNANGETRGDTLSRIEYQEEVMLKNQKRSKEYVFEDGGKNTTLSKLEYDGDEFFEKTLGFDSSMVMDCPYAFVYNDNGKTRTYKPDRFLPDYNLIVEYKEDGNSNPAYLKETKYKEKLKAEAVRRDGRFHYIIVYGNNYDNLTRVLNLIQDGKLKTRKNKKEKKYYIYNETINELPTHESDELKSSIHLYMLVFKNQINSIIDIGFMEYDKMNQYLSAMNGKYIEFTSIDFLYKTVELYSVNKVSEEDIKNFWIDVNTILNSETLNLEDEKVSITDLSYNSLMDLLSYNKISLFLDSSFNNNSDGLTDFYKQASTYNIQNIITNK